MKPFLQYFNELTATINFESIVSHLIENYRLKNYKIIFDHENNRGDFFVKCYAKCIIPIPQEIISKLADYKTLENLRLNIAERFIPKHCKLELNTALNHLEMIISKQLYAYQEDDYSYDLAGIKDFLKQIKINDDNYMGTKGFIINSLNNLNAS